MHTETICNKLLDEIPLLLSKNNPELGLLYFYAALHMAERDKLCESYIARLITALAQVICFISIDKQIALYERLLTIAETKKLTAQIVELHHTLGEIHAKRQTQASAVYTLKNITAKSMRYSNHITALANFVKSRVIVEQKISYDEADSVLENSHHAINKTEVVCQFDLLVELYVSQFFEFKNNSQDSVVELLQRFVSLATRLHNADLLNHAISVYQKVFELLSKQQSFYESTCLNEVDEMFLLKALLQLSQPKSTLNISKPLWQQNLEKLREVRETIKLRANELCEAIDTIRYNQDDITKLESLQSHTTAAMKKFISSLFKQAENLLGAPPCKYSVLGLGSIARGDMTPYSDLESILLVENTLSKNITAKKYFKTLLQLVDFQVRTLGESYDDNPGFHFDGECHPLLEESDRGPNASQVFKLIGTPEQILQRFGLTNLTGVNAEKEKDGLLAYTLLKPTLVSGSEDLFTNYQIQINQSLNKNIEQRHKKARAFIKMHIEEFEIINKSFIETEKFNKFCQIENSLLGPLTYFKKNLLGPLTHLLVDLAFYYQIPSYNLVYIITELSKQKILDDRFAQICRGMIAELYLLRLKNHFQSNQQNDKLLENSKIQILRLKYIFNGIITSLYQSSENLLLEHDKPYHPVLDHLSEMTSTHTFTLTGDYSVIAVNDNEQKNILYNAANYCLYSQQPTDINAAAICEIYQATSSPFFRAQLLEYLKTSKYWPLGNSFKQQALYHLAYQANQDGWYPAMDEENVKWLQTFSTLFQSSSPQEVELAKQNGKAIISCAVFNDGQSVNEYLLHDIVRNQLFDNTGLPRAKPSNQRGRHTVLKVTHLDQSFWFKFTPEQAGTEYAVNRLGRHIGDQGTPMSVILKISMGTNTEGIAVQVTPHIEGLTLEDTLQKHPERLRQLDHNSFAETLLRVLLTNPEDDKGDDYFVIPHKTEKDSFRLMRIDNERVFYYPDQEQGWITSNKVLQVKSILYCLPLMQQPLPSGILDKFLKLDPILVLQRWLGELQAEHMRYQQLFTDKDVETHFAIEEPGPCLLGLPIADGLIEELLTRLDSMQYVIRLANEHNNAISGLDLLKVVQPTLASYYVDAFLDIPDLDSAATLQRFDKVTKGLYQYNTNGIRESQIQSSKAITQSLRLKTKLNANVVLQMSRGKQNSPMQGLTILKNLQSFKLEDVKQALLSKDPKISEKAIIQFKNLVVRQRLQLFQEVVEQHEHNPLDREQQVIILRACAGIPFHKLSLKIFSEVLTDELLKPILRYAAASLVYLNLDQCWKISKSIQDNIVYCSNLIVLSINQLNIDDGKELKCFSLRGKFPKLQRCDLSGQKSLENIQIEAENLKTLQLKCCESLLKVSTASKHIALLDITECGKLTESGIEELAGSTGNLRILHINGTAISHLDFRKRFPFLTCLPFRQSNKKLAATIAKTIELECKKFNIEPEMISVGLAENLAEKIKYRLLNCHHLVDYANSNLNSMLVSSLTHVKSALILAYGQFYDDTGHNDIRDSWLRDSQIEVKEIAAQVCAVNAHQHNLPYATFTKLEKLLVNDRDLKQNVADVVSASVGVASSVFKPLIVPALVLNAASNSLTGRKLDTVAGAALAFGKIAQYEILSLDVIDKLVCHLSEEDHAIRSCSKNALIKIAQYQRFSDTVVANLLELLYEKEWVVRTGATVVLGFVAQHQGLDISATFKLLKLLDDEHPELLISAINALAQTSQYQKFSEDFLTMLINKLLPFLTDKNSEISAAAKTNLSLVIKHQGLSLQKINSLVDKLKDSNWNVRAGAVSILGFAGQHQGLPTKIVDLLECCLENKKLFLKTNILSALTNIAQGQELQKQVTEKILRQLENEQWYTQIGIVEVLTVNYVLHGHQFSAEGNKVLKKMLDNIHPKVRVTIAKSLAFARAYQPLAPAAKNTLIELLRDKDSNTFTAAANTMRHFLLNRNLLPKEGVTCLMTLLNDVDTIISTNAKKALGILVEPPLNSPEQLTAYHAVLLELESVKYLTKLLNESGADVRTNTIVALGILTSNQNKWSPHYIEMFNTAFSSLAPMKFLSIARNILPEWFSLKKYEPVIQACFKQDAGLSKSPYLSNSATLDKYQYNTENMTFFEAVAAKLNHINKNDQFTAAHLQKLIQDKKQSISFKDESRLSYSGRPQIEGRLLVELLNLKGILIVEHIFDPDGNSIKENTYIVLSDVLRLISQEKKLEYLSMKTLPIIYQLQSSSTYSTRSFSKMALDPEDIVVKSVNSTSSAGLFKISNTTKMTSVSSTASTELVNDDLKPML